GGELSHCKTSSTSRERPPCARPVKRPPYLQRQGWKHIQPPKTQSCDPVKASHHYPLIASRSHTFERMTNGVCARRTCVDNHLAWRRNSKRHLSIDDRLLRRIICDPRRRAPQIPGLP